MTQTPTDALRLVPVRATPQQLETAAFNLSAEIGAAEAMKLGPHIERAYELLVAAAPASPLPGGGCLGAEHLSAAITRLTQVVAGDEIEAAYADFTFPGHTFRADVRAVLSLLPAAPTGEPK